MKKLILSIAFVFAFNTVSNAESELKKGNLSSEEVVGTRCYDFAETAATINGQVNNLSYEEEHEVFSIYYDHCMGGASYEMEIE